MDQAVNYLIEAFVKRYSVMLNKLRPCKPGSEFLEQNLITLLSHEFLSHNPDGIAYSEIPFINKDNIDHWSSRLDAFLANDDEAFLVEAKGSQSKDNLFQLIEEDLKRIHSEQLKESFNVMATGDGRAYSMPSKVSGLIIADCWYKATADQWEANNNLSDEYPLISKIATKKYKVGEFGCYTYYVLAGQTSDLW